MKQRPRASRRSPLPDVSAGRRINSGWRMEFSVGTALAEPAFPALHPNMAEVFRQKATALSMGLQHDDQRDAAREALRGFVQAIVIPPGDDLLQVTGNLGAMLDAAAGQKMPGRQAVGYVGCGGSQPAVLAAVERRGMR